MRVQTFSKLKDRCTPISNKYATLLNIYCRVTLQWTITTCSAVVLRLCPLIPVPLSTLYLELYLVTSHHTSILPFSSLPSEVPPHFPFLLARSHFHLKHQKMSQNDKPLTEYLKLRPTTWVANTISSAFIRFRGQINGGTNDPVTFMHMTTVTKVPRSAVVKHPTWLLPFIARIFAALPCTFVIPVSSTL